MATERAYWNIDELSAYTGYAKGTLYNWVNERKIPYLKQNGNVRFNIERTKQWLESKPVNPRKAA